MPRGARVLTRMLLVPCSCACYTISSFDEFSIFTGHCCQMQALSMSVCSLACLKMEVGDSTQQLMSWIQS